MLWLVSWECSIMKSELIRASFFMIVEQVLQKGATGHTKIKESKGTSEQKRALQHKSKACLDQAPDSLTQANSFLCSSFQTPVSFPSNFKYGSR